MEKIGIYLHREIYNKIRQYGTIENVINRLLDSADEGLIEIYGKPVCPPIGEECIRTNVTINNLAYINMRNMLGVRNHDISLRRLLYWFADNDIGESLGWSKQKYCDIYDKKVIKYLNDSENCLMQVLLLVNDDDRLNKIKEVLTNIRRIKNELQ